MNLSDWGVVADIVVSIGIIITLVYLAIQVHQNTRQIKSQGLQASIANFLRNNQTFEGHDWSVSKRPIRDIQSSAKSLPSGPTLARAFSDPRSSSGTRVDQAPPDGYVRHSEFVRKTEPISESRRWVPH